MCVRVYTYIHLYIGVSLSKRLSKRTLHQRKMWRQTCWRTHLSVILAVHFFHTRADGPPWKFSSWANEDVRWMDSPRDSDRWMVYFDIRPIRSSRYGFQDSGAHLKINLMTLIYMYTWNAIFDSAKSGWEGICIVAHVGPTLSSSEWYETQTPYRLRTSLT